MDHTALLYHNHAFRCSDWISKSGLCVIGMLRIQDGTMGQSHTLEGMSDDLHVDCTWSNLLEVAGIHLSFTSPSFSCSASHFTH
jgi:hypothetical protein